MSSSSCCRRSADLASAEANAALAASTSTRWQSMLGTDAVSKQEVEEKSGDLAAKQALVNAQRANVERLRTMQGFTRIVAPFDGIVTARDTDVGALINAGGGGRELFVVSDTKRLRVYVNVPQVFREQSRVRDQSGDLRTGTSGQDVHRDGRSGIGRGERRHRHDIAAAERRQRGR